MIRLIWSSWINLRFGVDFVREKNRHTKNIPYIGAVFLGPIIIDVWKDMCGNDQSV